MSGSRRGGSHASRREFLKTGSSALAGAALAASLANRVHAGEDHTLKVALIGCGGRGAGAAMQALSTEGPVKLWAMADAFDDRLHTSLEGLEKGLNARYDRDASNGLGQRIDVPKERQFVGLDAYRKAIDSGVDVVVIAGPPGFRPQHFEYAVAAGKHVFMEKPLATDAIGVRRVLAAAEEAKRKNLKVGVGLQRHHQASYQEAIRRIHDGELGEILSLRCYWNSGPPAKTPFARQDLSELEYQVRNWYFFSWLSGDHICEQHIHNLDVCNWIVQAHPLEAEGMGGRQVRTGKEYGDIFDHHAVEFTYADDVKMFSQCRQTPGCSNRVTEHARGTSARADLGGGTCSIVRGGETIWKSQRARGGKGPNPYQVEHDVLFDAIRNDKPHNEAESGAISTMTAILGRLATYSGKRITWDDAFESEIKLTTDAERWDAAAPTLADERGFYPVAVPGVARVV
ncbi:MAG TPA: Gfo/Idh/MocA family oxidoreductase [Pirellulales bacterium]|nr:Gfo/Idh/MocA family oxidoreductase [Pirellulales bacterium]